MVKFSIYLNRRVFIMIRRCLCVFVYFSFFIHPYCKLCLLKCLFWSAGLKRLCFSAYWLWAGWPYAWKTSQDPQNTYHRTWTATTRMCTNLHFKTMTSLFLDTKDNVTMRKYYHEKNLYTICELWRPRQAYSLIRISSSIHVYCTISVDYVHGQQNPWSDLDFQ